MDLSAHHKMLPGMKPRPVLILNEKNNCNEVIQPEENATFVHLKKCENYELKVEGKAAKILCENSKNVSVAVEKTLIGGVFEVLRSQDIKITALEDSEIPILQIYDSEDIEVQVCNKDQLKSIYFQRTKRVKVLLVPNGDAFDVNLSLASDQQSGDEIMQLVAHWNKEKTELVTASVARSGVYPIQK
eukprot:gene19233-21161_t